MKPRVVFMGEKPLAQKCLEDLVQREASIKGITTRKETEDRWWGEQAIHGQAKQYEIPIIDRQDVKKIEPDIIISVLYPFIIEEDILDSARKSYNLHLAPLPEYKGCNPGSHAIIDGATEFGVTLHEMTPELDKGRIVEKRTFPIARHETAKTLYKKAEQAGYAVWLDNIDSILDGTVKTSPYIDDGSKPHARDSLKNKQIPPGLSREQAYAFIRGLDFEPFEPAHFTDQQGERYNLRAADFDKSSLSLKNDSLEEAFSAYLNRN